MDFVINGFYEAI